jgi:hypothetical protein
MTNFIRFVISLCVVNKENLINEIVNTKRLNFITQRQYGSKA